MKEFPTRIPLSSKAVNNQFSAKWWYIRLCTVFLGHSIYGHPLWMSLIEIYNDQGEHIKPKQQT